MNARFHFLIAALLFACSQVCAIEPAFSQSASSADSLLELKQEIESLKATITTQAKELAQQRGAIDVLQRRDGGATAALAAAGVVLAAMVAGLIALRNQNKQAAQERLLKAIEIIMDSRSGYQAEMRRRNLEVFLDEVTKEHLKDIGKNFSGPEFTDLHVDLAQAMAEKASTPEEVLRIWTAVLEHKKVFTNVAYPEK